MLSGPVMPPPPPDTPRGLVRDLPPAVLWWGSDAVCLQEMTLLSENINAASRKSSGMRFVYQANQDCFFCFFFCFVIVSQKHTCRHTDTHCSDFLSAHSRIQWALQRNTHLAAQFLHVPVPFRPDSKALNISGVLRRVCNMVIPVSGLAFPVSVPTAGLWFDSAGAKSYLEGDQPACQLRAVNKRTLAHTMWKCEHEWAHKIPYIDILPNCACIHTYRWRVRHEHAVTQYANPYTPNMQEHMPCMYHTGVE